MATNPMKRKSNNAFLLGVLVTLLISACIIAFLLLQMKKMSEEISSEEDPLVNVIALTKNVQSGQEITDDMLKTLTIKKSMLPGDAESNYDRFSNYKLTTADGKEIETLLDENNQAVMYIINGTNKNDKTRLYKEVNSNDYYTLTNQNEKQYVKLNTSALIAKINMAENTVLTLDMVAKSDETITDDVRRQEYNCIVLPLDLQTNNYIDVRLMLPNGQDFIVVAKKQVTVPLNTDGTTNEDTIWMNLSEDETLTMSSAIVEAFKITGAKLYATVYTDAGMQEPATPTYPVNAEATALIQNNPNILQEAKDKLYQRYTQEFQNMRNNEINQAIQAQEDADTNYQEQMQESITKSKEDRQKYLQTVTQY